MPKLANMLGPTGRVEIPVTDDEPLVVEYRRASLTPRLQARLMDLQKAARDAEATGAIEGSALLEMCAIYAQVIVSWNLTDEWGTPIGTDGESLADVDFGTLNLVMQTIGRELNPDPLSANGSSNGSSPTADSEPRLITTAS